LARYSSDLSSDLPGVIDKIKRILYDSTVGLAEEYRRRSVELIKIQAATFYLQAVRSLRQHVILLFTIFFMLFVAAIAAVVLPAVLILALPISAAWKIFAVVVLALIDIVVPAIYVYRISSEQHWIKASRADEFIKDAMNN
jgi:hypothetical protein